MAQDEIMIASQFLIVFLLYMAMCVCSSLVTDHDNPSNIALDRFVDLKDAELLARCSSVLMPVLIGDGFLKTSDDNDNYSACLPAEIADILPALIRMIRSTDIQNEHVCMIQLSSVFSEMSRSSMARQVLTN